RPHRGDIVLHAQPGQRLVVATPQYYTSPFEAGVLADFPAAAVHDHRGSAVVEAGAAEVADLLAGGEGAAAKAFAFVEGDLRRRMSGDYERGYRQGGFKFRVH